MTENSTALLFDILDTATQGDPDSAANNIALLNQLLTATDNDPSNISANEIALLTEILSIITDQPPDVAANEIALLTEILSAIQSQNPQVRANKIALLNEIAANSQSLVDALNPVTLPVAASDLVAWYPFRTGTGEDLTAGDSDFGDTTDYSATVNGATFQASGGVTDIETGPNSGAFDFDGTDDSLSGPPDIIPAGDNDITVTGFIKPDTKSGNTIFSCGDQASVGEKFAFRTDTANSQHNLRYENSGNDVISSLTVPTGQFSFVSVVYQVGGNVEFQLGTQTETGTILANDIDPVENFRIGRLLQPGFHFDGIIDGVRIYTTALSQNQRDQIRQNTKP